MLDFFLRGLSRHLYLRTEIGELPPGKRENFYLEELHSHFIQAEMKTLRLWQRRVRPRNRLELPENDQTELFLTTEHCWHVIGALSVFIN